MKTTLAALALVAATTPALANISIEDQRTHPGIVVDPRGLEFYLKQPPLPPFGALAPLDESTLPPPPADENAPMWVVPKRIDV